MLHLFLLDYPNLPLSTIVCTLLRRRLCISWRALRNCEADGLGLGFSFPFGYRLWGCSLITGGGVSSSLRSSFDWHLLQAANTSQSLPRVSGSFLSPSLLPPPTLSFHLCFLSQVAPFPLPFAFCLHPTLVLVSILHFLFIGLTSSWSNSFLLGGFLSLFWMLSLASSIAAPFEGWHQLPAAIYIGWWATGNQLHFQGLWQWHHQLLPPRKLARSFLFAEIYGTSHQGIAVV